MKRWQEDLLSITDGVQCEHAVFQKIEAAAQSLGFEHCAYGLRVPFPISKPQTVILNNYPAAWQARYASQEYLQIDPTVLHGRRSQAPLIWSEKVFAASPELWDEAQSFGLCVGWAQSSLDAVGVGGMLTLSRSQDVLSVMELASQEIKMRWLVNIAHLTLSRVFISQRVKQIQQELTAREIEVLKWTADGKTSEYLPKLIVTKSCHL